MKPTILYFDDEEMQLTLFAEMFSDEYEVRAASTLIEARAILSFCPEIVISDWSMPGISGLEFLREAARSCPKSFRILLTGYGQVADVMLEVGRGVIQLFMPKPWNETEMRTALERAFLLRSR
ncbi:MAG: response regulator [Acidobacteriota bacterium]|nr:response regulator [Acidobacteriota bacterium]